MTQRHKTFLSYHHANDQASKNLLVGMLQGYAIDLSVRDGDLAEDLMTETIRRKIRDEYIRDATVTLVLVGAETWKRKHVDWGSSCRPIRPPGPTPTTRTPSRLDCTTTWSAASRRSTPGAATRRRSRAGSTTPSSGGIR